MRQFINIVENMTSPLPRLSKRYGDAAKNLFEAPIGNIDNVGEFLPHGSYRKHDARLLQSAKHFRKIEQAFRHTKETIDVLFVPLASKIEDITLHQEAVAGIHNRAYAEQLLDKTFPAPSSPQAITLILTNNDGTNAVPMSPWIVAHRMGHAIAAHEEDDYGSMVNLWFAINDFLGRLRDALDVSSMDVIYAIATMASARNKKLNGRLEIVFECFSQYLITGDIKFKRFDDPVTINGNTHPNLLAKEVNRNLEGLEDALKRRIDRLLADLRGKVVVL